jgi:hypothetical protein
MAYRIKAAGKKEELIASLEEAILLAKDLSVLSGREVVVIEESPIKGMTFSKTVAKFAPAPPHPPDRFPFPKKEPKGPGGDEDPLGSMEM